MDVNPEVEQDQPLTELDLKKLFEKRRVTNQHNCNEKFPETTYRERYRQPGFIQDAIRNRDPPHSGNPQKCCHRVVRPLLTRFGCTHCRKTHNEPSDCAIVRYHAGELLIQSDAKVLAMFPCIVTPRTTQRKCASPCIRFASLAVVRGHGPFTV